MQLSEIERTKARLKSAGLKPKEYLGQNFLIDEEALAEAVGSAGLTAKDTVLEVGPGLGVLTEKLAQEAGRVVAVEKDPRLMGLLRARFKPMKNVEIVPGDILKFHVAKTIPGAYKVVANIPYYLTSKLISVLLEQEHRPELMVIMVQKEVAQRITAKPGNLSILSLSVNFFAQAEIIRLVPKESFWPKPEVDSAIIRIRSKATLPDVDRKFFFRLLHLAFSGKRKQIHNTLGKALDIPRPMLDGILSSLGLDSTVRPQELSLSQWLELTGKLSGRQQKK
ncbi:MAG: 16S rRNA (adenine(1518)-N(6)/adenine(1519)-N(6))-dimethyltransferase RsmA [Candidatus Saccharibacteria bacterium]